MGIFTLFIAIAVAFLSFLEQNRYPVHQMRYRGRTEQEKRIPTVLSIRNVYLHGDQPYAQCLADDGEEIDLAVDSSVVKRFSEERQLKVLCFKQNDRYELAEPDLRYQTWVGVVENDSKEWEDRKRTILRVRDVRIVLLTTAIIGFHRSPTISLLCSIISAILLFLYCTRVEYTSRQKYGIISEKETPKEVKKKEKKEETPVLYDTWSESKKYLYEIQQQQLAEKAVEEEMEKSFTDEIPVLDSQLTQQINMPLKERKEPIDKKSADEIKSTIEYLISLDEKE